MGKIAKQILDNTRKLGRKTAFFYYENGQEKTLSYDLFRRLIFAFQSAVQKENIPSGGSVILVGENSPRWPAAYLAAHVCGLTVIHGDIRFSGLEFETIERFTAPSLILCEKSFSHFFSETRKKIFFETISAHQADTQQSIVDLRENQPMSIIFTSGTTGEPKGVMLSESNFLSNLTMFESDEKLIREKDRIVAILPFHHVYPFTCTVLGPLYFGAALIYPRSLKGEDIFGALKKYRGTILITIPKLLELFCEKIFQNIESLSRFKKACFYLMLRVSKSLQWAGIDPAKVFFSAIHKNFPGFRFFSCGGAKLNTDVHIKLKQLGFTILEAYGLTETSPLAAINDLSCPRPGSIGKAAPGIRLKIEPSEFQKEHGEICIKGPNVMMGYYKRPDLTGQAVIDGWFHSGDLGYMDKKGHLYITGRKKEMIVLSNGKNIYPEELENLYRKSEKIKELCVVLLENEGREFLTLAVFPDKEFFMRYKSVGIMEEITFIIETIAQGLPSYQRVTRIELVDEELPRTALGKLKRYKVAEILRKRRQHSGRESEAEAYLSADPFLVFVGENLRLKSIPSYHCYLETDLGLDSLAKIDFFSALENRYSIKISEEKMAGVLTLKDIKKFLPVKEAGKKVSGDFSFEAKIISAPDRPLCEHVSVSHNFFITASRFIFYLALKIFLKIFFEAEVKGRENLKDLRCAFIIAPNHVSLIDGFIIYGLFPFSVIKNCFFISIPTYFTRLPYSLIRKWGRIIITGTQDTLIASLQYSYQVLKQGRVMCVFPEGRRSLNGSMEEPKKGIGHVAIKAGAPLLPVFISGTDRLYSRTSPGFHKAKIKIEILPRIDPEKDVDQFLKKWKNVLQEFRNRP